MGKNIIDTFLREHSENVIEVSDIGNEDVKEPKMKEFLNWLETS